MHLGSSKFAFRLRETLGRIVFPAQGHTKRVTGAQNLRFACAKRSRGSRPDCFPCAGPHKTRLPRSKFAFRLRRATKSDDKDAMRHESDTWILQKLLRYIWMLRHGSGDMDLAEELVRIRRHGSCRGALLETCLGHMDPTRQRFSNDLSRWLLLPSPQRPFSHVSMPGFLI